MADDTSIPEETPAEKPEKPVKDKPAAEFAEKEHTEETKPVAAKPVVWPPHRPVRTFFAAIFGIIALLLILATILVVWFNRTVTDTDTYVKTVTPLASQPDLQEFVADRVTEGIVKATATEAELVGIVPPAEAKDKDVEQLQALAKDNIRKSVLEVVQSPNFQNQWHETNLKAHDRLMTQLASNKKEISLDFTPLVNGVMEELKRTELAPLTEEVVLPADIGKVSMGGVAIDKVGRYYNWLQTATLTLIIAAGVAAALCIVLSTHHIRTVRRILMGTGIISLSFAALLQLPIWLQSQFATSAQKVAIAIGDVLFSDLKVALVVIGVSSIALALVSKVISVVRRRSLKPKKPVAPKTP